MIVSHRQQSARPAELFVAFFALCVVVLAQVIGTRCLDLFNHPLWLDETFTSRIANDPSFSHVITAVAGGVDTNPPTLYLALWPIARVFGSLGNIELRVFALLSMLAAMTGLYAICRRVFARGPSAVAVLAVWAHPMIIEQAFEARFYAPWLALTVWFCYLQMRADDDAIEPASRWIVRYVLGVLATSIHYFGVITMVMIAVTDFVVYRRFKRLMPALIGMLVVAACFPFVRGQRASLSIPTWIDPVNASEIKDALVSVFGAPSIIFVLLFMWITTLLRRAEPVADQPNRNLRELLPISSLLAFPAAIVAFSVIVQPALVLRYLILAVAPLAPMLAYLISRSGRGAIALASVGLIAVGAVSIVGRSNLTRGLDREFENVIQLIDQQVPADALIVFKRRREMYPVLQIRPDLAPRVAQLDFDDSVLGNVSRMSQYERDMGRKVQLVYPELRTTTTEELARVGKFYVITPIDEYRELQLQLPGFDVANPESVLHEVTAKR
ncbi:MAG: glycosyltransferase family 39 protein [Anaerolineae bacterium]|nr:glycosyltransferase family 39 protein [Phycisphaerae bacterium]